MINGILYSSRGCLKEEMKMDIVTNNLANANVVGFKKDRISFNEFLNQAESKKVPQNMSKPQIVDTGLITIKTDMEQGDIRSTGNSLDMAIFGDGFFKVNTPQGIRYTRKGNFSLDSGGSLITREGYNVMGKNGPISIIGSNIDVDGAGKIVSDGGEAGQLDLVGFDNDEDLLKEGSGLYRHKNDEPGTTIPSETRVKQGYLELSNVNIVEEMVKMIQSLRAFESYQRSIKVLDSIDNKSINEVGKLR